MGITVVFGANSPTTTDTLASENNGDISSSNQPEIIQTLENRPDLVMTNVTVPADGAIGGQIIVPNTVKNQGNAAAGGGGFYVTYYLSQNKDLNNSISLGSRYIEANDYFGLFGAGASSTVNTVLTIPKNIREGHYYFIAMADGYKAIAESNEDNNVFVSDLMINVQNGPDLVMTSITAPAIGIRNRTITVVNTVKNQGNLATSGFYITYYLTPTQNLNKRIIIGYRHIQSLAAGASNTAGTKLTIPSTIALGQYYIAAVADYKKQINEVNEANNHGFSAFKMTVRDGRDLVVTNIRAISASLTGRTITVSSTIKNQGNLATGGFYVTYYLTTHQNMNNRTWIGSRYIKSLAAGTSNTPGTKLTIPKFTAVGKYYIAAVADSTNRIAEVNEYNNNVYSAGRIILTIDKTSPIIKSTKPAKYAARVPLTSLITITFSENIRPSTNFAKSISKI